MCTVFLFWSLLCAILLQSNFYSYSSLSACRNIYFVFCKLVLHGISQPRIKLLLLFFVRLHFCVFALSELNTCTKMTTFTLQMGSHSGTYGTDTKWMCNFVSASRLTNTHTCRVLGQGDSGSSEPAVTCRSRCSGKPLLTATIDDLIKLSPQRPAAGGGEDGVVFGVCPWVCVFGGSWRCVWEQVRWGVSRRPCACLPLA